RAFRRAAAVLDELERGELERRIDTGTLEALPGIGATTAQVIIEAAAGRQPGYLARLLRAAAEVRHPGGPGDQHQGRRRDRRWRRGSPRALAAAPARPRPPGP
ncbi:MAG TPA: hypothetical protein VEF71_24770, partial [Streptosporangiaceae bacterium]|nr:hypothetical protein [Streptosporangiaceae bacterium]